MTRDNKRRMAAALLTKSNATEALAGAGGIRGQLKNQLADSAYPQAGGQPATCDEKRFSTLRAVLALAGWALTRTDASDGPATYSAARWNMARELASLDAVAEFADRVGVTR